MTTLSDKINYGEYIDVKDVKEFIKRFIEECKCNSCRDLIRELVGEELSK